MRLNTLSPAAVQSLLRSALAVVSVQAWAKLVAVVTKVRNHVQVVLYAQVSKAVKCL